jgi:hypothetical protein
MPGKLVVGVVGELRRMGNYCSNIIVHFLQQLFNHPKALFTRDIFAHNIAIKRYCNICHFLAIDFYSNRFLLNNQGKLLLNLVNDLMYLVLGFDKRSPWPIDIHGPKTSFYRNIFLSKYCPQKCLV